MSELQHSQKFVEEIDSAEVRQTCMITGDSEICGMDCWPVPPPNTDQVVAAFARAGPAI
jgi:hypothetical protein